MGIFLPRVGRSGPQSPPAPPSLPVNMSKSFLSCNEDAFKDTIKTGIVEISQCFYPFCVPFVRGTLYRRPFSCHWESDFFWLRDTATALTIRLKLLISSDTRQHNTDKKACQKRHYASSHADQAAGMRVICPWRFRQISLMDARNRICWRPASTTSQAKVTVRLLQSSIQQRTVTCWS